MTVFELGSMTDSMLPRQGMFWESVPNSGKAPAEVPLPKLIEELPPPPFVAPKGWLDDLCEEVRIQFNRQDTEQFAFWIGHRFYKAVGY